MKAALVGVGFERRGLFLVGERQRLVDEAPAEPCAQILAQRE